MSEAIEYKQAAWVSLPQAALFKRHPNVSMLVYFDIGAGYV